MCSEEKGTTGIEIRNREKIKIRSIVKAAGGISIEIPPAASINKYEF